MSLIVRDEVETRHGVSWEAFQVLLDDKDERPVPRVTYLDGVLELVTPSRGHEKHGSWIGALIAVFAVERGVTLSSFGSWLLVDKLRAAGAEPDDCYILGEDPDDKLERPHFVIEVEWSRPAIDKLEVYRRLDVAEVWFWRKGAITVYVLDGERWEVVERSPSLPDLDLAQLVSFLDRPAMTTAMRRFRAALRG